MDVAPFVAMVFSTAAGVAARSAAQIAAEPGKDVATAAVVGTVTFAVEDASEASEAIWFAASSARPAEAAALVARIAAIGRIADPFTPVDIAATLAAGRLTVEPSLDAPVVAADRLAAGSALIGVRVGHSLFIRSAEERALSAATRTATTPAHILATAAAGEEGESTEKQCRPGNHREVL